MAADHELLPEGADGTERRDDRVADECRHVLSLEYLLRRYLLQRWDYDVRHKLTPLLRRELG